LNDRPAQRGEQGNNRFEGAGRGQQQRGHGNHGNQPAAQAPSVMASAFSKLQALRK
jgi:uncharacterized protein